MGGVNAVYTLGCAHRRQLLAARALNERSLLIRGLPFPRTKTIGTYIYIYILMISSFSAFLHFSDVLADSSPIEVQRADVLTSCRCHKCGQVRQYTHGRVLVRTPGRRFRHARMLLQRLLGGWALALAFRREVFARLDVSCTAATQTMPSEWSSCLSQGSLFCWKRTCGRNPAKGSTLRMHLHVALAAALRPSHKRLQAGYA